MTKLQHKPTGKHLTLDGWGVDFAKLNDHELLIGILKVAAKRANATILKTEYKIFEPQGVTVFCVLAESHISIHTYPEHGMFMADIFTCGETCNPSAAAAYLIDQLDPTQNTTKLWIRGLH